MLTHIGVFCALEGNHGSSGCATVSVCPPRPLFGRRDKGPSAALGKLRIFTLPISLDIGDFRILT